MAGTKKINSDLDILGKVKVDTVPNNTGTVVTYNPSSKELSTRTDSQIISDLGLITAANIAAAYYTKTQLQTSGQAQVNWGNLTNVPATFPATAHNHDDRYYTETESDTKYVPYTGATSDVNLASRGIHFTTGSLTKLQSTSRVHNKVYQGHTNNAVGILAIKIPSAANGAVMFDISIKFYGYSNRYLADMRFSFYRISNESFHPSGYASTLIDTGNFPASTLNVGIDDSNNICLYIGDIDTVWGGIGVFEVERVAVSYGGTGSDWSNGWSNTIETIQPKTVANGGNLKALYNIALSSTYQYATSTKVFDFETGYSNSQAVSRLYIGSSTHTGFVEILVGATPSSYTGYIKLSGAIEGGTTNIYNQTLRCVETSGNTNMGIYIDPIVRYDSTVEQLYVNIHKKILTNLKVWVNLKLSRGFISNLTSYKPFISPWSTTDVIITDQTNISDSHTHANKAFLDTINQNLGTTHTPTFAGVNANASSATVWATSRTLTIGNTGKSVNGSANVSWTLAEIGAMSTAYLTGRQMADANNPTVGSDFYYLGGSNKPTGVTDGALLHQSHSSLWATQMFSDWRTNRWYVRNKNNNVWGAWQNIWTSADFTSTNISNWNTAYTWGNHAGLYSPLNHDHDTRYYTKPQVDAMFTASEADKYKTTITQSGEVEHMLNTYDVTVEFYDTSTMFTVGARVQRLTTNKVKVEFDTTPTNPIKVLIRKF